jgi:hypothetical protein
MDRLYSFDSFFDRESRGIMFFFMDLLELRDQSICYCHDMGHLFSQFVRVGCMVAVPLTIEIRLIYESLGLETPEGLIYHRSVILCISHEICYQLVWRLE